MVQCRKICWNKFSKLMHALVLVVRQRPVVCPALGKGWAWRGKPGDAEAEVAWIGQSLFQIIFCFLTTLVTRLRAHQAHSIQCRSPCLDGMWLPRISITSLLVSRREGAKFVRRRRTPACRIGNMHVTRLAPCPASCDARSGGNVYHATDQGQSKMRSSESDS